MADNGARKILSAPLYRNIEGTFADGLAQPPESSEEQISPTQGKRIGANITRTRCLSIRIKASSLEQLFPTNLAPAWESDPW